MKWQKWQIEDTKNRTMRRVSMEVQIFLAVIPFMALVAAYRVGKFKRFTLMYAVTMFAFFFSIIIIIQYFYSYIYDNPLSAIFFSLITSDFWLFIFLLNPLISSLILMYFIIKWTKQWNKLVTFRESLESVSQ
jgi:hypothetical protein